MTGILALPSVDHKSTDHNGEESKNALTGILHSHHVEHCMYLPTSPLKLLLASRSSQSCCIALLCRVLTSRPAALLWDMATFIDVKPQDRDMGIHIVHSAHLLASLHYLGATPARLQAVYASESKILPPPEAARGTITAENWRAFLGRRSHTREYLDFFERELARLGGDWRALVELYVLGPGPQGEGEGKGKGEVLAKSISGDLCHPLIHLAYAYELQSGELATDALTYCAVHYRPETQRYVDWRSSSSSSSSSPPPAAATASSPLEVLENIRRDARLDGFPPVPGRDHFGTLFDKYEDVILGHWRAWPPPGPITAEHFRQAFDASVALVVGSSRDGEAYDFILLHVLTGCHALRVLLPEIPEAHRAVLFNQWWLFTLTVFITQRPTIDDSLISNYSLEGRDWSYPIKLATESQAGFDAHYVKAIRAIHVASGVGLLYGGQSPDWYLKAATRFAEGFKRYKGFGPVDDDLVKQLIALSGQGSSRRH